MGVWEKQKRVREYRGQIVSPGRPTVAWREDRVRFWQSIAAGAKTREAGEAAGVSEPVAHRWFKHAEASQVLCRCYTGCGSLTLAS